jgi:hypothetical protein
MKTETRREKVERMDDVSILMNGGTCAPSYGTGVASGGISNLTKSGCSTANGYQPLAALGREGSTKPWQLARRLPKTSTS